MGGKSFYRCEICGNFFAVVEDGGVVPECCGQAMTPVEPNTSDGAGEKHVPVLVRDGNRVTVKVGAAAHPMLPEHYISWIILINGSRTQRSVLEPGGAPEATFTIEDASGPVKAYEYCTVHGLWSADS